MDDRVDGRELEQRDEPGSDDLLLRGLLLRLALIDRAIGDPVSPDADK